MGIYKYIFPSEMEWWKRERERERKVCWLPGQRGILIITIRLKGASVAGATHTRSVTNGNGEWCRPVRGKRGGCIYIHKYMRTEG